MKGEKPLRVTDCSSIEHACLRVAYVKTSNDITSSFLAGNIRDFRIHQRDGDKNAKKENTFNKQNNNLAHASHLFVQFFAIFAQLCLAMPNFAFYGERKQTLTKFIFLFLHLDMVLKNSTPVGFTFN